MSLFCKMGMHSWDGCKCSNCGKVQDENHSWKKDDCATCFKCGEIKFENHSWDGCKCTKCGKTKDENHSWKKDDCSACTKCGTVKRENHTWDHCKCLKCGKIKDENHSWDGCKCTKCGKTKDENHSWKKDDCGTCANCGRVNNSNHLWEDCKCVKCGVTKNFNHKIVDGVCVKCGYKPSISDRTDEIIKAIEKNDLAFIDRIMSTYVNADTEILSNKNCIIHEVAENGTADMMRVVFKYQHDIHLTTPSDASTVSFLEAIHFAAFRKNLEVIKLLVEKGVNINQKVSSKNKYFGGRTPLFLVITRVKSEDFAIDLVKLGASLFSEDMIDALIQVREYKWLKFLNAVPKPKLKHTHYQISVREVQSEEKKSGMGYVYSTKFSAHAFTFGNTTDLGFVNLPDGSKSGTFPKFCQIVTAYDGIVAVISVSGSFDGRHEHSCRLWPHEIYSAEKLIRLQEEQFYATVLEFTFTPISK